MHRKLIIIVIATLVGSATVLVFGANVYLKYSDPVGYENAKRCPTIKPGVTEADLISLLGQPIHIEPSQDGKFQWLSFATPSIAAGFIRAQSSSTSKKIAKLRCDEDGSDTWALN